MKNWMKMEKKIIRYTEYHWAPSQISTDLMLWDTSYLVHFQLIWQSDFRQVPFETSNKM